MSDEFNSNLQDLAEWTQKSDPNKSMGIHYGKKPPVLFSFLMGIVEFLFTAAMVVIALWAAGLL